MSYSVKLTGFKYATALYAGDSSGYIHQSLDTGFTWSTLGNLPAAVRAMSWWTPSRGLAVCSSGVYLTTDSGMSWTQVVSGDYYGVATSETNMGAVVCGASAALKYTTDGGLTWSDSTKMAMGTTTLYAVSSCRTDAYLVVGDAYAGAAVFLWGVSNGATFAQDIAGSPGSSKLLHVDVAPTVTSKAAVMSGETGDAYLYNTGAFTSGTGEGFGESCGALIVSETSHGGPVRSLVGGSAQLNASSYGIAYSVPTGWNLSDPIYAMATLRSCRTTVLVIGQRKTAMSFNGGTTWIDRVSPPGTWGTPWDTYGGCAAAVDGYLTVAPSLILPVRQ